MPPYARDLCLVNLRFLQYPTGVQARFQLHSLTAGPMCVKLAHILALHLDGCPAIDVLTVLLDDFLFDGAKWVLGELTLRRVLPETACAAVLARVGLKIEQEYGLLTPTPRAFLATAGVNFLQYGYKVLECAVALQAVMSAAPVPFYVLVREHGTEWVDA